MAVVNSLLDNALVGLALLVSIGYAVLALGPKALRKTLLMGASRLLGGAPAFLGLGKIAGKLASAGSVKAAGACGGCEDCGSGAGSAQSAGGEINVPVAKIGRRNLT